MSLLLFHARFSDELFLKEEGMLNRGLFSAFLVSVFLIFQTGFSAYAEELNGFEFTKIIDTDVQVPGTDTTFSSFGPPQISDGKIYFVGTHLVRGKKDIFYPNEGLYMVDEDGLHVLADFRTNIPGDKKGRKLIRFLDFSVDGETVIFVAGDKDFKEEKLYIYRNSTVEVLVDEKLKVKSVSQKLKHFGRVVAENGVVVFEIGGDLNEGLVYWKDGEFIELAGKKVKKRKRGEPYIYTRVTKIQSFDILGDKILFSAREKVASDAGDKNMQIYTYSLDEPDKAPEKFVPGISGERVSYLNNMAATPTGVFVEGFYFETPELTPGGWGGIYHVKEGVADPLINKNTPFPGLSFSSVIDDPLAVDFGDYERFVYSLYSSSARFGPRGGWNRVYTENQGNIGVFALRSEMSQGNTSVHSATGMSKSGVISLANFFQSPLFGGHGNLTGFGDGVIFHGISFNGHEGLFYSDGGPLSIIILNTDEIFGLIPRHLFIGSKGSYRDSFVFWAKLSKLAFAGGNETIILAEKIANP